MQRFFKLVAGVVVGMSWPVAQAATIQALSPQGEVPQARQITAKFSEAVVPFGDLRLPDPLALQCQGGNPAGAGRWVNDRVWVFDFREALPPGVRCTLKARADWKPLNGALTGTTEFNFGAGGPAVVSVQPGTGAGIEEDQHFLLQLNGPAVDATVASQAWCEVEGIGERVPLKIVTGKPRDELIAARKLEKQAERLLLLTCARPLPNDVKLRLVWGKGIAARANPKVLTSIEQQFDFRVRKAFTAEFTCEREKATAPCLPIRPLGAVLNGIEPKGVFQYYHYLEGYNSANAGGDDDTPISPLPRKSKPRITEGTES